MRSLPCIAIASFLILASCSDADQQSDADRPSASAEQESGVADVAPEGVRAPSNWTVGSTPTGDSAGEWILHGLSGGEQRYSPIDQINENSVSRLGLAFEYDDFIVRGNTERGGEATPLMDDGVLYFTGPWSVVYAIDAKTGEELWIHDPEVDGARARVTCCDAVNRGVALSGDKVFVATLDGYLIALNKVSGELVWKVDTFVSRDTSHSITGAPRLAGDVIVIGNGGAEMGVRGYVSAFDVDSGRAEVALFYCAKRRTGRND